MQGSKNREGVRGTGSSSGKAVFQVEEPCGDPQTERGTEFSGVMDGMEVGAGRPIAGTFGELVEDEIKGTSLSTTKG